MDLLILTIPGSKHASCPDPLVGQSEALVGGQLPGGLRGCLAGEPELALVASEWRPAPVLIRGQGRVHGTFYSHDTGISLECPGPRRARWEQWLSTGASGRGSVSLQEHWLWAGSEYGGSGAPSRRGEDQTGGCVHSVPGLEHSTRGAAGRQRVSRRSEHQAQAPDKWRGHQPERGHKGPRDRGNRAVHLPRDSFPLCREASS